MKYQHVMVIVDETLSGRIKFADDMDEAFWSAWRIIPGLSEGDGFVDFRFLLLDCQNLSSVSFATYFDMANIKPFRAFYSLVQ